MLRDRPKWHGRVLRKVEICISGFGTVQVLSFIPNSSAINNVIYVCAVIKCGRHIGEAQPTSPVADNAEVWQPCSDPYKMLREARTLLSEEDW